MRLLEHKDPFEISLFRDLAHQIPSGPGQDLSFPDPARNLRFLYYAVRELPVLLHASIEPDISCLEPRYPSFRGDTNREILFASPSPLLVLEVVAWKLLGRRRLFCYDYSGRLLGRGLTLRGVSIDPKFAERLRDTIVTVYLGPASSFELGWRRCWCDRLTLGLVRAMNEHVSRRRVPPLASVKVKLGILFDDAWRHGRFEPRPWTILRNGLPSLRWNQTAVASESLRPSLAAVTGERRPLDEIQS
jgi:hypothetical protein